MEQLPHDSVSVDCPHCSKPLTVKTQFAGRGGQCPKCKGTFVIPETAEEVIILPERTISEPQQPKSEALSEEESEPPLASYLGWPKRTIFILLALGMLGSLAGAGATAGSASNLFPALVVTLLLNPLIWAIFFVLPYLGLLSCPKCRYSFDAPQDVKLTTDIAEIRCPSCKAKLLVPLRGQQ